MERNFVCMVGVDPLKFGSRWSGEFCLDGGCSALSWGHRCGLWRHSTRFEMGNQDVVCSASPFIRGIF
jgi:hypothetical protein